MKLIARKPCSFGGEKFYIGDEIPTESVLNPKEQENMGVLAVVFTDGEEPAPETEASEKVSVLDINIDGMTLSITAEGLQAVVDAMRATATDAEPIVSGMDDGDALILLHACDSRKAIKAAAESRAAALGGEN